MHRILLLGAGKIGRMISRLLVDSGDFAVSVADADDAALQRIAERVDVATHRLDASDRAQLTKVMDECDSVISALSFRFNPLVAEVALATGTSYFDLTEDVETTRKVRAISKKATLGQIFMPQCGLAPGFISIVANHLTKAFDQLDTVRMRVGALPQFPTGALKYNLTWSTDGLINEYCNPCEAIHERQPYRSVAAGGTRAFFSRWRPVRGVQHQWRAWHTVRDARREGARVELQDCSLPGASRSRCCYAGQRVAANEKRELLKEILEDSVPITFQDVVVTFCTVTGRETGSWCKSATRVKSITNSIADENWSAIQITTAGGICAVVDMHASGQLPQRRDSSATGAGRFLASFCPIGSASITTGSENPPSFSSRGDANESGEE